MKQLSLSDNEIRLYYLLLTGTERDKAIHDTGMSKFDIPFLVTRLKNELDRRKMIGDEYNDYQKILEYQVIQERNERIAKTFKDRKEKAKENK